MVIPFVLMDEEFFVISGSGHSRIRKRNASDDLFRVSGMLNSDGPGAVWLGSSNSQISAGIYNQIPVSKAFQKLEGSIHSVTFGNSTKVHGHPFLS